MIKVLHLITGLTRGGIESWLLSMLRAIPRSRCAMDFSCKGADTGELAEVAQRLGARVHHCPLGPGHLAFGRELRRLLVAGDYHILHNHLELYSGFPVWVARRLRVPVISSFHNTHFAPQLSWSRRFLVRQLRWAYGAVSVRHALRRSDLVTGCSRGVLASLDPRGRVLDPRRRRVLYYGVDVPDLPIPAERATFRASLGCPADTPILLHVGRFIEQKNHLGLLAVFRRVVQTIPEARLLLVGEGLLRPEIERAVAEHGLNDLVRFLGPRDDVPALMGRSDLFLFPSFYEGFGLVAIEANAAGLPVVGSRVPGLTEAVRDGITALLHEVTDVDGMADSVIRLLRDRRLADQFTEAGRAWVRDHFSVAASAARLVETYESLASSGRGNERVPLTASPSREEA